MATTQSLSILVPGAGHTLEGRLFRATDPAAPLAVVAPPHPLYGGTLGNPVVRAIEGAFRGAGVASLAFNFRGAGLSGGEPSGALEDALADYLAAARAVPDARLTCLSGYSFGGIAALASALELGAPRVLMVAPPLGLLDPELVARHRGRLVVVVGDADEYAPVEAVHTLFGPHLDAQVHVLEGVDHFFLGSATHALSQALTALLAKENLGDA